MGLHDGFGRDVHSLNQDLGFLPRIEFTLLIS